MAAAPITGATQHLDVSRQRILVVDDEPAVRTSLERALRDAGYDVTLAGDGHAALERAADGFDVIVLDVSMPGIDGLEVARLLRQAGDRTPVLMLTARDAVADRVSGLDSGADDYLVKPFALQELHARLRALLRRTEPAEGMPTLVYDDLRMDVKAHEAYRGERRLELTRTEWSLLQFFLEHPQTLLGRVTIFEHVWGYDFGPSSNTLGVYIGYLRRKIEAGDETRLLHTVRGIGYILKAGD